MSTVERILLDLDGPLLDGKERHYFCYRRILERFQFKPIGIDEYWKKKREGGNRSDLLSISGAAEIYEDFLAAWLDIIESPEALALDRVQDGAIDCLRSWKERQIHLTLVTMRRNKCALDEQLVNLGLRPLLDTVVACKYDDGGTGKANAVRKICTDNAFAGDALWVGDTEADWEAATLLGCKVVLLSNGLRDEAYLRSLEGAIVKPSIVSLKNC